MEELRRYAMNDLPLEWANKIHSMQHLADPPSDFVKRVLAVVPEVVDSEKQYEDADPYVLAHGLYLQDNGKVVTIVTEEKKDYPWKISMVSACQRLSLPCQSMKDFLDKRGIPRY